MKFLLDECVPFRLADPLSAMFRAHEFTSVQQRQWRGTKDLDLFERAASHGIDYLISLDGKILDNPSERAGLRASGLHMVLLQRPPGGRMDFVSLALSQMVSGLSLVFGHSPDGPTVYHLRAVPHHHEKRFRVEHL